MLSILAVSLFSLVGVLFLVINKKALQKILLILVSFSAGSLLGDVFIHLLPEAIEKNGISSASWGVLGGIIFFFVLEKFIAWRHCHVPTSTSHPHPVGVMNLVGDGVHNLTDGMVIAASYLAGLPVGIATTVAVIFHEIPQEIGDFGVLIHAGFSHKRALFFNFLSATMAILGGILTFVAGNYIAHFSIAVLPFTAGGFLYIAGSDLIPELHKEVGLKNSLLQMAGLVCGIGVMILLKRLG